MSCHQRGREERLSSGKHTDTTRSGWIVTLERALLDYPATASLFRSRAIKETYWKGREEKERKKKKTCNGDGMILTWLLWRPLLPPLFSWLNVIPLDCIGRRRGRLRRDTNRESRWCVFEPSDSKRKKRMYYTKMILYLQALVVVTSNSVVTRLAKAAHPHAQSPWTLNSFSENSRGSGLSSDGPPSRKLSRNNMGFSLAILVSMGRSHVGLHCIAALSGHGSLSFFSSGRCMNGRESIICT